MAKKAEKAAQPAETTTATVEDKKPDLMEQVMAATLNKVAMVDDLSKLTDQEKVAHYRAVCEVLGLNPWTKPFAYMQMKGRGGEGPRLVLYATKSCSEQLAEKHKISVEIVSRERVDDCWVVTVRASNSEGRKLENVGAVSLVRENGKWNNGYWNGDGTYAELRGEFQANARMKAETKALRRVILAFCGLGMLDEAETESIPGATMLGQIPIGGDGPKTKAAEEPRPNTQGVIQGYGGDTEEQGRRKIAADAFEKLCVGAKSIEVVEKAYLGNKAEIEKYDDEARRRCLKAGQEARKRIGQPTPESIEVQTDKAVAKLDACTLPSELGQAMNELNDYQAVLKKAANKECATRFEAAHKAAVERCVNNAAKANMEAAGDEGEPKINWG